MYTRDVTTERREKLPVVYHYPRQLSTINKEFPPKGKQRSELSRYNNESQHLRLVWFSIPGSLTKILAMSKLRQCQNLSKKDIVWIITIPIYG